MKRFIQILTILLVIQIAVTAFIFWPQGTAQAISGPLLPDFAGADVVTLTIHDENDNHLALAKHDGEWVLPEADDFPVDSEKVATLLEAIEGVTVNRLVTQTEASHKRLKVGQDDFNRLVDCKRQTVKNLMGRTELIHDQETKPTSACAGQIPG